MKVRNRTNYDTRDLRRVICATHAVQSLRRWEGKRHARWMGATFDVVYSRYGYSTGYAYLGGWYSRLRLPRTGLTVRSLAWLVWHELMHLRGYRHGAGCDAPTEALDQIERRLDARGQHVAQRETSRKMVTAAERGLRLRQRRAANAERKLKEWTMKRKRAETMEAKWCAKVKYYERTLADAGGQEEG